MLIFNLLKPEWIQLKYQNKKEISLKKLSCSGEVEMLVYKYTQTFRYCLKVNVTKCNGNTFSKWMITYRNYTSDKKWKTNWVTAVADQGLLQRRPSITGQQHFSFADFLNLLFTFELHLEGNPTSCTGQGRTPSHILYVLPNIVPHNPPLTWRLFSKSKCLCKWIMCLLIIKNYGLLTYCLKHNCKYWNYL